MFYVYLAVFLFGIGVFKKQRATRCKDKVGVCSLKTAKKVLPLPPIFGYTNGFEKWNSETLKNLIRDFFKSRYQISKSRYQNFRWRYRVFFRGTLCVFWGLEGKNCDFLIYVKELTLCAHKTEGGCWPLGKSFITLQPFSLDNVVSREGERGLKA